MAKKNVAVELRKLRGRLDLSMRSMARALGYKDGSSYQRYEDPEKMEDKQLPIKLALLIIGKFDGKGTPPINREEVLALVGNELSRHANHSPLPVRGLSVEGIVAAGLWREVDFPWDAGGDAEVPADPRFAEVRQFALLVEGQSVNLLIQDGEYAICSRFSDLGREPLAGELVVVERTRDGGLHEYSIKRLKSTTGGRFELWPESTHPDFQTPLSLGKPSEHTSVMVIAKVLGKYAPMEP
jgi:hypothetical protein